MADCPYFLRSKRRRLNNTGVLEEADFFISLPSPTRRKNFIAFLPTEILMMVFKNLSNKELVKCVRGVNRRFKSVAERILNTTFKAIKKQLLLIKADTMFGVDVALYPKDVRFHCRLLNVIEILIFYYELTMATIWRYVYVPRRKSCMYAGELLDNYLKFLKKYFQNPKDICSIGKSKYYKAVPRLVHVIRNQTKIFCRHFENVSEMPINSISNSGAKLLDILDTDHYTVKTGYEERFCGNTYYCKLNYFMRHAWFAAIESKDTKVQRMNWREHQKYMYMRLRRMVVAHSEVQMNELQYLREFERMQNTPNAVPKPRSFMYSGYGEEDNRFFFYGVMNHQCYIRRYPDEVHENSADIRLEAIEMEDPASIDSSVHHDYQLGVHLMVTLKCPVRLAPRKVLEKYSKLNELNSTVKGTFDLKLQIISPGNSQIRVPNEFCFHVQGKRK